MTATTQLRQQDISDEMRQVIHALRGHDDKVRVVLNKADQVDQQQLMRVYGALMWSLGKVFKTPEVCRVYVGSFNAGGDNSAASGSGEGAGGDGAAAAAPPPPPPSKNPECARLFAREQAALMDDLAEVPARCCDRKVNEFVKRVRALRVHMLLVGAARRAMPAVFGKEKAQRRLLDELPQIFREVRARGGCRWVIEGGLA